MKVQSFETREEWLTARRGKITGTSLKDIVVKRGTGKKIGFYQLIADRLGIPADDESPMDRGIRLEPEALALFASETGKKVDSSLVLWINDEVPDIAVSPDGTIGKTEAVDAKCLSSARHLEAYLTQQLPDDYEFQKLQYFITNEKLKNLYFAFYDPRVIAKPFFYLTFHRKDLEEEIQQYFQYQKDVLREVDDIVTKLTF